MDQSPERKSATECHFITNDNVELFYRHWPTSGKRCGAVVMFHRGHEHSGRIAHRVDELGLEDFDYFAWDARGHGLSPGERGFSPSLGTTVCDVQTFIDHIHDEHGIAPADMIVLAQSVGAVLIATWVHDYAPQVRAMVLVSPAFKVKLYIPFARPGLRLMHKLRGNFFVNSYVKAKFLTHDPERQASYDSDPLIARAISVNILLGLYDVAERVVSDARAITIPTQLLISGADWVVEHEPQYEFFARLGFQVKEIHLFDGFFHDTLGEANRERAIGLVRDFIRRQFEEPATIVDLNDADKSGYTYEEARELAEPLPDGSFKDWWWKLYCKGLGWSGMVSEGVSLGQHTGFDSGSTLDYVYRNEARGNGAIGRMVDRKYLNAIGWRGIRQRKQHLEALIYLAITRLHDAKQPIKVLDIAAAGHGRYVLDALNTVGTELRPDSVLLCDYSDINVRDGARLINERGLGGIARFEKGDAFDTDSVASAQPGTTLGIVSGLYELYP
jgi:alpha-beta hydrolase superfamily lysophospholipase